MKRLLFALAVVSLCLRIPVFGTGEPAFFSDVTTDDWYYDSVLDLYGRGLMIGTGDGNFSPGVTVSRAMAAVILHRFAGTPEEAESPSFPDVPDGEWYTEGITWAARNGMFLGYEDGRFGPEDDLTREQLAAILFRYQAALEAENYDSKPLPQGAQTSDWATEYAAWSWSKGLLYPGLGLDFRDPVCRGETAYLFHRLFILSEAKIPNPAEESQDVHETDLTPVPSANLFENEKKCIKQFALCLPMRTKGNCFYTTNRAG